MNPNSFIEAVDLISIHGYLFVFILMVIEGPIVNAAAAFASALGFFDVYLIFILAILANLLADFVCYGVGYWGRLKVVENYGQKFGLNSQRVAKIERLLKQNLFATIATIKIAPGLATPGLIIVGAVRVPFRKFVETNLYMTIPLALIFTVLGYYTGLANAIADKYLHHSQYWLILAVAGIIIGSYLYKKISASIARKIEKI